MNYGNRLLLGIVGATIFFTSPAIAADRNQQIQRAIDRGVAILKTKQNQNGVRMYRWA